MFISCCLRLMENLALSRICHPLCPSVILTIFLQFVTLEQTH